MKVTAQFILLIAAVAVVIFQGLRIRALEKADISFYADTVARSEARDREISILERRIERAEDKSGTR